MTAASIFKEPLTPGSTLLRGYTGCKPLAVGLDADGQPSVWFQQYGPNGGCDVEVLTIGTGHLFEPWGWAYIGTFTMPADGLVLHAYWRARQR